jgi:hypothetical protein
MDDKVSSLSLLGIMIWGVVFVALLLLTLPCMIGDNK